GNPAKYAGFPLFHRLGYGRLTKPDISLATKTGHFNLLTTAFSFWPLALGFYSAVSAILGGLPTN
ncbi:MAG: hypothetical protein ABSG40_20975, partial [Terriglobales bacterium]